LNLFVQTLGFGVVSASIIAVGAMGFTIQFGLTNVLNLSFGAVMTVSAFVAYLTEEAGINIWLGLVLGGVAGAVLTTLLGRTVFKLYAQRGTRLFEMVMVTLGLGLVIEYAVDAISRDRVFSVSFPQGASYHLGAAILTESQLAIVGIGLVIFLGLEALLRLTRLGKALRAMAVDPGLARSCGIPTSRIVNATWIISGFLCGIAGVIYVINSLTVSYTTGLLFLPVVLAAAILGGVGSPRGAMLAALLLGIVTQLVAAAGFSAYSSIAAFGVLVIVLLSRPSGVLTAAARKVELTL
jgi:branched-chain amino acid transport system permease protein/neutral amino acid transport system permease protein